MNNKSKIILSFVVFVASMTVFVISTIMAEQGIVSTPYATVLVTVATILLFASISYAAKVDYETGVYECRKCGHIFKPTFNSYLWGAHTLTTRYLKCPKCEKKSWSKRKIAK